MRSLNHRLYRLTLGCAAFTLLALFAGLLGGSLAYTRLVDQLPSLAQVPVLLDPATGLWMQPTRLYDRTGQKLLYSLENPGISRRALKVDQAQPDHFSPELLRVTLGVIDPGFWNSPGFSLRHLTSQTPVTIPEKLVDDLLLWQEPHGLWRALRMRILAGQLVARYGHVQVLEWYLNSAYYGHQAFSGDSAARLYLGKSAGQVDLPEAALLVAASQAPALNPLDAPVSALQNQRAVLDRLSASGVISAQEYVRAVKESLHLSPPAGPEASPAMAFSQQVLERLSERFGRDRLERGGLRIVTTLDYPLQLELDCLVRTQLARLSGQAITIRMPDGSACQAAQLLPTLPEGDLRLPQGVLASGVVLDPQTGEVLAMLGDTSAEGQTANVSLSPPGSLLTPFVAVTSFARGIGPASLVWDIPSSLPTDLATRKNPDGKFHGPVRVRTALANDYLTPLAQMLEQMGAPSVWRLASELGLYHLAEERSPELLYQGGGVSTLEMAQAYGVFASLGVRAGQRMSLGGDLRPATVLSVEDANGEPLLDAQPPETRSVVSAPLAFLIHHVLSDAAARQASLGYPNPLEIGRPSGAKIGQVEGGAQVWTAGYTPQRVAVFSLSLPEESRLAGTALAPRMVAGMWHAVMQYASRDLPVVDWSEPAGITHLDVCNPSGQLPTRDCPDVVSEVFLTGSEPSASDTLYHTYPINRETNRLATVFTPPELIEEKTYLVVPEEARTWAASAGIAMPPQAYDAIQPPQPSPDVRITGPALFAYVKGRLAIQGTAAGDGFRSYQVLVGQGLNPRSWTQVGGGGSTPVTAGTLADWDTQGLDGLYAIRLQVVRQDQSVDTATVQVTVDNTAPQVRIPYPAGGQDFDSSQERVITFQAEASDAIGIQRLTWWLDGVQVGESVHAPFAFAWQAKPGRHVLEVRAEDLAGNVGKSEPAAFSVK